jgi:hypothetical protein
MTMTRATLLRLLVGLTELAGPDRPPLRALWTQPVDHRMRTAARILAARDLAGAAALTLRPGRRLSLLLASADALHTASMIGLAAASPRYRRPALASAATATVLAWIQTAPGRGTA